MNYKILYHRIGDSVYFGTSTSMESAGFYSETQHGLFLVEWNEAWRGWFQLMTGEELIDHTFDTEAEAVAYIEETFKKIYSSFSQ